MPRPRTGTVRFVAGRWEAKFTKVDGSRGPWTPLRADLGPNDRAAAKAEAARMAPKVLAESAKKKAESVRDWFGRLHDVKAARGLATVKDMRGRAARWVFPVFGDKAMRAVTSDDGEQLVARLDAAVAAFLKHGPGKGRLSPSTAANVWGDVCHAFDEAVHAKDPGLRVLDRNPLAGVRGPEGGDERSGQILFSDEALALLGCERVPLYRRQTYAMALYTACRASELEALKPADVDLEHGTITVSKQADRKSKRRQGTKQTKTRRVRTIDIELHAAPLVELLAAHPAGRGGRLLHMPPPEDRAELLRKDLQTAGVTRGALFVEGDPSQRAITFHDLRDTCLVHMAVRGDSPIAIQWRGGHTDFKTTQGYLDRGRVEARRIGEPLPPLPPGIVHESSRTIQAGPNSPVSLRDSATPTGIEPVLPT